MKPIYCKENELYDRLDKVIELLEFQNEEIQSRKKGWQALDDMVNHECEPIEGDTETEEIFDKCCMEKGEDEDEDNIRRKVGGFTVDSLRNERADKEDKYEAEKMYHNAIIFKERIDDIEKNIEKIIHELAEHEKSIENLLGELSLVDDKFNKINNKIEFLEENLNKIIRKGQI